MAANWTKEVQSKSAPEDPAEIKARGEKAGDDVGCVLVNRVVFGSHVRLRQDAVRMR